MFGRRGTRCCCGGIGNCLDCCSDGRPDEIDFTIPSGFTNASGCNGCTSFAATYTLTQQAIAAIYCDGSDTLIDGSAGCSYYHRTPNVCTGGSILFNFDKYASLRFDDDGCYWISILQLSGQSGLTRYCEQWVYESSRQAGGWSDCATREFTLSLTEDNGCVGDTNGFPFFCNLCNTPPSTITLQAA